MSRGVLTRQRARVPRRAPVMVQRTGVFHSARRLPLPGSLRSTARCACACQQCRQACKA
jgi:hypothetical protein